MNKANKKRNCSVREGRGYMMVMFLVMVKAYSLG